MNQIEKIRDSRPRVIGLLASLLACFALVMTLVPVQAIAIDDTPESATEETTGGDGASQDGEDADNGDGAPSEDLKVISAPDPARGLMYTGAPQKLLPTAEGYDISFVPDEGQTAADVDFATDASTVLATKAGEYNFTITLKPGYTWEGGTNALTRTVEIAPLDIKGASFSYSKYATLMEDEEAAKANVTITYEGKPLVEGVDYIVEYLDNDSLGNAHINIEGIGNYSGKTSLGDYEVVAPQAIYRLYCPVNMEHLYTLDENEYEYLKEHGWDDEGVGWVAPKKSSTPVYRLYNSITRQHLYTTDENERKVLSTERGWTDEGIKFYSDENMTAPVKRLYNDSLKIHLSTTDQNEIDTNLTRGWKLDTGGATFFAARAVK